MTAGESIIRAGVVGAGVFGGYHAQKYAALDGVSLTAIFDCDGSKAKALADVSDAKPYTDYQKFLSSVDAISIAAPAEAHFELAKTALSAGVHCLVEKPISLTEAEAQILIDTASASGLVLQVGHQERFVAQAAGLFDNTGKIRKASFQRLCLPSGRCEDVSATLDLMIHDLDLARQLGFGEPVRAEASGDNHETAATLWFADGRRIDFAASRRASVQNRTLTLHTESEVIDFDFVTKSGSNGCCADIADPLGLGVAQFIGAVRGINPVAISGESGRDALKWAMLIENARLKKQTQKQAKQEAVA